MLKRNLKKLAALAVVAVMLMTMLVGCAPRLSGTYTADGLIEQSFTFKEDNVVVFSAFGVEAEGTYEIKDDKITITYKILNLSYDMEKSFEKKGNSIFIDGTEFVKEK